MNTELKKEIYSKYKTYLSQNYNEKYINRLIIQEGYNQQDVDEVIKDIYSEKQKILKKKNKHSRIISILLYIVGTAVIVSGIAFIVLGGVKIGMGLIFLAVIVWINANR
ncbi:hypothetical protein [Chryseobacterium salviniae]|uniref:DUF2157 domain-containing protein n=1 Tax=Chryseobacterium salviniae TaxID=3101750 RepID=A0ABU6HZY1_9FLAO|nr:hypothetical protein [Chryseobacterium sp. T9W2-O]MEC3877552.1 hypothetical protein [Chryseobacterium sp. T9W2-O]